MKYSVITFGCRVNQADSLGFEEQLRTAGAVASAPSDADLVIVNTCSVTATADQGARQTIRRLARENPRAHVVVTGCYATRRPGEVGQLPDVDRVALNDDKPMIVPLTLARLREEFTTADRFGDGDGACGAAVEHAIEWPLEPGLAGRTTFTLRVQTGCAEPCSYCIIPTTRGNPRSVPADIVLAEVRRVAAAGFKEIALTGVHLGSYGRDLDSRTSLLELLRALDRGAALESYRDRDPSSLFGDLLFRISSLEPMDCPAELVDLVARSPRFAPHFHLPLQHASGRMLAAMRRPYTLEQYAPLVDRIRERIPDASIGSDIIVGFPGETDVDFEELVSYLERSPLTHVHVFPYSDRPGTPAAAMGGKVNGAVVRERSRRVREIGQGLGTVFRDGQVGRIHRGLTIEDGSLVVTGNYLKVRIPPGQVRNQWVDVRITSATTAEVT